MDHSFGAACCGTLSPNVQIRHHSYHFSQYASHQKYLKCTVWSIYRFHWIRPNRLQPSLQITSTVSIPVIWCTLPRNALRCIYFITLEDLLLLPFTIVIGPMQQPSIRWMSFSVSNSSDFTASRSFKPSETHSMTASLRYNFHRFPKEATSICRKSRKVYISFLEDFYNLMFTDPTCLNYFRASKLNINKTWVYFTVSPAIFIQQRLNCQP